MASVFGINNIMDTQIYDKIKVYEGVGNSGFCGWGVRDRGELMPDDKTLFCRLWRPSAGSTISWLRYRIASLGSGLCTLTFTFWEKRASASKYTRVGRVFLRSDDVDLSPGEHTYPLLQPIHFSSSPDTECAMAVHCLGVGLSCTSDTGAATALATNGDVSESLFDWNPITNPNVALSPTAVSAEAFDAPIDWSLVLEGGAISGPETDWQDASYCTSSTWSNPGNIYDGDASTSATSTAGNGAAIVIDLGAGLEPEEPWHRQNKFPDYSSFGVRAVHRMEITGTIATGGGIAVSYSDADQSTAPISGWETIYWNDTTVGAGEIKIFDDEISIPVVARWIKITEVGASTTDTVSSFKVYSMQARVTNGEFGVEPSEDPNLVWVESYVTRDKVYAMTIGNIAGAESPLSYPCTNRRYRD